MMIDGCTPSAQRARDLLVRSVMILRCSLPMTLSLLCSASALTASCAADSNDADDGEGEDKADSAKRPECPTDTAVNQFANPEKAQPLTEENGFSGCGYISEDQAKEEFVDFFAVPSRGEEGSYCFHLVVPHPADFTVFDWGDDLKNPTETNDAFNGGDELFHIFFTKFDKPGTLRYFSVSDANASLIKPDEPYYVDFTKFVTGTAECPRTDPSSGTIGDIDDGGGDFP